VHSNRALFAGFDYTVANFPGIERLARSVVLYDENGRIFDRFVSRKTFAAFEALSATSYAVAVVGRTRVHDFALGISAIHAFHKYSTSRFNITIITFFLVLVERFEQIYDIYACPRTFL